jgi:hypothetical protein
MTSYLFLGQSFKWWAKSLGLPKHDPHQRNIYYLTSNYQNARFMEMAQGLTIISTQVLMRMIQRGKEGLVGKWTWNGWIKLYIEIGSLIKYLWEA